MIKVKKEDRIFIILLILSNILGWIFLYTQTRDDVVFEKQNNIEDSIKIELNESYLFDHSKID